MPEPDWKQKQTGCDKYEWFEGDTEKKVDLTRPPAPEPIREPEKVAVVVRP